MFGLNCTTFGCEKTTTEASRIATTVPLNITQLLEMFNGISINNSSAESDLTTSTEEEVTATTSDVTTEEEVTSTTSDMTTAEEVTPTTSDMTTAEKGTLTTYSTSSIQVASTPTAPVTFSIYSSLVEELESAISNVLSIASTMRKFTCFFYCHPALDKWK